MIALRWEILRPVEPWAQPQSVLLGFPLLSGTIQRQDYGDDVDQVALCAPCDPIAVPAAIEGERNFLLRLEVFGGFPWAVTIGTPSHPPQPSDGEVHANDPTPAVIVPCGGMAGSSRSVEIRAVRPGSLFIARPSKS